MFWKIQSQILIVSVFVQLRKEFTFGKLAVSPGPRGRGWLQTRTECEKIDSGTITFYYEIDPRHH